MSYEAILIVSQSLPRPLEPLDPEREINWTLSCSMLLQMLCQMLHWLRDAAATSCDAASAFYDASSATLACCGSVLQHIS